jgi:hypothetical protein
MAEDAEVREDMDRPEASEETDEDELDLCMNAGRGGAREAKTIEPCSSTRISALDVSARVESLS